MVVHGASQEDQYGLLAGGSYVWAGPCRKWDLDLGKWGVGE